MGHAAKHDAVKSTVRAETNTVGTEALRLASKGDDKIEARDIQGEADKEYFDEIVKCVSSEPAKNWVDPFYVVIMVTKPGYLINVIRRRFFARQTLPEPSPDQTVWRFHPKTGDLEYLWSLPDLDAINEISMNRNFLRKEDAMLGQMVVDYLEKKLWAKHLPNN